VELVDAGVAVRVKASDVPVDGLSAAEVAGFHKGDAVFDLPFRESDGLGPYYVRNACGACHGDGARGPGLAQRMAVVEADGVTTAVDQTLLAWGHTVRKGLAAGAVTPLLPPDDARVKVTRRLGPPVFGRGYLEAIADDEILKGEAAQATRTDGVHGRVNRVTYASVPNPDSSFGAFTQGQTNLIGRFGVKARIATLDDFTADAFLGDMGLTTPMRPVELPNPDGLVDDARPGVDLDQAHVDDTAFYLRRIAIPARAQLSAEGAALFQRAQCDVCHVPTLHTRADYPVAPLADVDAPVFTDLLLHDLGPALADGMADESAHSQEWRTAPLIGLRFCAEYLHDGRAATVEAAITAHAGEAQPSVDAFNALSPTERTTLLQYVDAL
jgi:CxxC motif-containing protein (DUF1111 family)